MDCDVVLLISLMRLELSSLIKSLVVLRPVVFRREEFVVEFTVMLPLVQSAHAGAASLRIRLTVLDEEAASSQHRTYRVTTEPIRDMTGSGTPHMKTQLSFG